MGLKKPESILVCEFLGCGWRADAKRGDKTKRAVFHLRRYREGPANKQRNRAVDRADENPGMGHRADRTLMARQLGVVSVYVDRLDDAGESDQQDT